MTNIFYIMTYLYDIEFCFSLNTDKPALLKAEKIIRKIKGIVYQQFLNYFYC